MIGLETKHETQPLKVLAGLNSRLELYADRVEISRTDFFGKLLPDWIGAGQNVPLTDLKGVYLTESRGADSPWMLLVLITHKGHRILMAFQRHDYKLAHEIKALIDAQISE